MDAKDQLEMDDVRAKGKASIARSEKITADGDVLSEQLAQQSKDRADKLDRDDEEATPLP